MKRSTVLSMAGAVTITLAGFSPRAEACGGESKSGGQTASAQATQPAGVRMVSTQDVALRMAERDLKKTAKPFAVVDVNGDQTRKKMGVIPGAILLTSSSKFDAKELPENKDASLVFYCANERCSASKTAAYKAVEFGYQDVSVLPVGIAGWVEGGYKTGMPQS